MAHERTLPPQRRASLVGRLGLEQLVAREGIFARGQAWALGWSAPVIFGLFHQQPSAEDFTRFIEAQAKDIDDWPSWYQRCVIHHVTVAGALSADQRQQAAELVNARRDKLKTICLGYAFCTRSGAVRGLSKVIHWLAPPPYPLFHAATVTEGLKMLQKVDNRVDPSALLGRYQMLFEEYLSPREGREL